MSSSSSPKTSTFLALSRKVVPSNQPADAAKVVLTPATTSFLSWEKVEGESPQRRYAESHNLSQQLKLLEVFDEQAGAASRVAVGEGTSQRSSMFAMVLANSEGTFIVPANNLIETVIKTTNGLYERAVRKCNEILLNIDWSDEENRIEARRLLKTVLSIFAEMAEYVVRGLSETYRNDPDIVGFLLAEVLVEIDDLDAGQKAAIISSFVHSDRAGVRYEAVRALDLLGSAATRDLFQQALSSEANREVRALIDAGLRRPM